MRIKQKILSTVIMLLITGISLANPLDGQPTKTAPAPSVGAHHFFVQFDIAYATSDWASIVNPAPDAGGVEAGVNDSDQDGFFYGGIFGVSLIPHVYIDVGAFHLPTVNYSNEPGGQISSWLIDVSGKLMVPVPVVTSLNFFGSVGIGYRVVNDSKNTVGNRSYWMPVFGAGAQYDIYQNLYFGLEYMRIARDNGPSAAPRVNSYLAFLNYQFNS